MINSLLPLRWPLPKGVKAASSTRCGGVSLAPYDSLNLGDHVLDDPLNVEKNRELLRQYTELPNDPCWLQQVHGTDVYKVTESRTITPQADAAYSNQRGQVCVVMTADCLPVLFCSTSGDEVAAAHAGWRGLCHGVLENTLACFRSPPEEISVWLGPAIGPQQFEVGEEVKSAFIEKDGQAESAFAPHPQNNSKFLADIYLLARQRLQKWGIRQIYGGEYCTVTDSERFFSYRRDKETGRMASLIWLE